jgi:acyl transferase domain-containing protein
LLRTLNFYCWISERYFETMASPMPIAVIGMGCRLPGGANSPEQLWEMIAEGRSGWSEVPADRVRMNAFSY